LTTNIKVTFDESALGRLYLWLLSLDDETPAVDKLDIDKTTGVDFIPAVPTPNEEVRHETIDSDS
jgi:hypothetical protein